MRTPSAHGSMWQVAATHFRRANNWATEHSSYQTRTHTLPWCRSRSSSGECGATLPIFICLLLLPPHIRTNFFLLLLLVRFFLSISFVASTLRTFIRLRCHFSSVVCRAVCRTKRNALRPILNDLPTGLHLLPTVKTKWLDAIYAAFFSSSHRFCSIYLERWCWISVWLYISFICIAIVLNDCVACRVGICNSVLPFIWLARYPQCVCIAEIKSNIPPPRNYPLRRDKYVGNESIKCARTAHPQHTCL